MILIVLLSILVLASLVGNTLVILTVLLNRPLQSTLNFLLVNLAVADMFFAVFTGSQFVVSPLITHPDGSTGRFLCSVVTGGPTAWIGGAVSVLSLIYISVERYFAIIYPPRQRGRLTRRRLKWFIFFAWILVVLITIPIYIGHTRYYDPNLQSCVKEHKTSWISKVDSLLWFFGAGVIPVSIMVYTYSRVVVRLRFKTIKSSETSQKAALRHRKRVTITVIIVSVIYAICWIPNVTDYVIASWGRAGQTLWFEKVTIALLTFNASVNPVLYSIQMKRFRDHLRDTLLCKRKKGKGYVSCDSATRTNIIDHMHTKGCIFMGSAASTTALPTTAPLQSSSETNSNTVATEAFIHVAKLQRKSPAGNIFPLNMAANTENKDVSEDAVTVFNSAAQSVETKSELQTIGTLNEDERTLKADLNTKTKEKDEASPTSLAESRVTLTNPVSVIHGLEEFQNLRGPFTATF